VKNSDGEKFNGLTQISYRNLIHLGLLLAVILCRDFLMWIEHCISKVCLDKKLLEKATFCAQAIL